MYDFFPFFDSLSVYAKIAFKWTKLKCVWFSFCINQTYTNFTFGFIGKICVYKKRAKKYAVKALFHTHKTTKNVIILGL